MAMRTQLDGVASIHNSSVAQHSICYLTFETEAEQRAFIDKYAHFKIFDQKDKPVIGGNAEDSFKRSFSLNVVKAPYQDDGGEKWGQSTKIQTEETPETREKLEEAFESLADLPEFEQFMETQKDYEKPMIPLG
jgi:hypothetical protein